MLGMRTCLPCHIPDRWSRNVNRIWPDLAFGFVHKRSGNEIRLQQEWRRIYYAFCKRRWTNRTNKGKNRNFCHDSMMVMYESNRSFNIPPRAYPVHLTSFLAREGGDLITTHKGWGIWSLASISCYEINHGGDVKLWWIRRKRLRIFGGLVEIQRSTQAVFLIWRRLRTIYVYSL